MRFQQFKLEAGQVAVLDYETLTVHIITFKGDLQELDIEEELYDLGFNTFTYMAAS